MIKCKMFRASKVLAALTLILLPVNTFAENSGQESNVLPETVVEAKNDKVIDPLIAQNSTSATKTDTPIMETSRSISVVTAERFNEQGAETVQDALLYSAGVYGATYGFDSRGDWAIIRGSEPVQYQDGLKSLFGYYNNVRPHPYSLSSIEILKGPSSVLYGQGTAGGIINLVSKLPDAEAENQVYAEYGSHDRREFGADLNSVLSTDAQFRLVSIFRESNTQVNTVEDDNVNVNPSITWQPSSDTKFTLLANYQKSATGTATQFLPWEGTILPAPNGRIPTSTFLSEPGWDKYDTDQQSLTGIFEHRFDDVWSVDARMRYTDSSSDYYTMYPDFPPTLNKDGRTLSRTIYIAEKEAEAFVSDVRVNAEFETGIFSHKLSLGSDVQNSTLNENSFYGYGAGGIIDVYSPVYGNIPDPALTELSPSPETDMYQVGVYLLDQIKVGEGWRLSAGLRDDHTKSETDDDQPSQSDGDFTKTFGVMHIFDNGIAPYASYAESFNPVLGRDGNGETFEPLEGEQYEVGVKYQPPGSSSIYTLSAFDLTEKNQLTSDPNNPANSLQTGEVRFKGIEFENQIRVTERLDAIFNYSVMDDEITESNDGTEGNHVASVPESLLSTWITYRPFASIEGLKFGVGARYVGDSWDGADTLKTPSYTLYDAMVAYDVGSWSVSLNAQNLEDQSYVSTCLARGDCFYGERRSVVANVSYNF